MVDPISVSELTFYIRDLFAYDARLQDIWVTGEVSNLSRAASGHCYFTLKDGNCQIKCVMWRSSVERQSYMPANGDAINLHGYVGVYEANGVYQLYADSIRPAGVGDLYAQFERLKSRLEAEGLFDEARKRPIPTFPQKIGVVTSAEAAAFQDIQNVLRRRFPLVEIVLSPCPVQGNEAPPKIVAALERINRCDDIDVILLIRGGGSIEDLWAFNDERVARAVAASRIPVICGVGHETDFTIADFAADLRAPTPSAAAEIATPHIEDLRATLRAMDDDLHGCIEDCLDTLRDSLMNAQRTLGHVSPAIRLQNYRQRIDDWNARMTSAERNRLTLLRERLAARSQAMKAANPLALLERGYAIIYRSEDGQPVASVKDAKPGTGLTIRLRDGELTARVEDKETHGRYKRTLF